MKPLFLFEKVERVGVHFVRMEHKKEEEEGEGKGGKGVVKGERCYTVPGNLERCLKDSQSREFVFFC